MRNIDGILKELREALGKIFPQPVAVPVRVKDYVLKENNT